MAAARPALLERGLRPLDRSLESHWVRPGAATAVRLHPGDVLTVINRDGGQLAELTVLDIEGGEDGAAIGVRADAEAGVLQGPDRRRRGGRVPRGAPRRGPDPRRGARPAAVRPRRDARRVGVVHRRARGDRDRRRARGPGRRRRLAGLAAPAGDPQGDPARARGDRASAAAGRAAARLPRRPRHGGGLRGRRRRVHPDHRRRGQAVLGLPRLQPRQARARAGARTRRDHDPHPDGLRLPAAGALSAAASTSTWTRWSRSSRTPSAATTASPSPAPRSTTRTSATPATSTARRTSTGR